METTRGTSELAQPQAGQNPWPLLGALGLVLLAGCAGNSPFDKTDPVFTRVFTPQVPEFLSGPAAALLTNTPGFSARAIYESHPPQAVKGVETLEGELLGNGTRLLFAPRSSETPSRKDFELGGFSFIWDVATGSGYILSEALQGYAPVSSTVKPEKVTMQASGGRGEQPAVVTLNNGSAWLFQVTLPADQMGVPARISSVTNAPPFTLKISKVRRESPPQNLFAPPEGFVRYATPEALADELATRKNSTRRRPSY